LKTPPFIKAGFSFIQMNLKPAVQQALYIIHLILKAPHARQTSFAAKLSAKTNIHPI